MLLCCAAALAQALEPGKGLQGFSRQVWSTENGLPQNSVHAILQSRDGYLWLGTEGGLARFDGYQFRVFEPESNPGLMSGDIRCLLEDRGGVLWVGTASGLTWMAGQGEPRFIAAEGLPAGPVRSMLETDDGRLWVLTDGGLGEAVIEGIDPGKLRFRSVSEFPGLKNVSVLSIAKSGENAVWVGTTAGLERIGGDRVEQGPAALAGRSVDALAVDSSGQELLIGTSDGVMRLSHGVVAGLGGPASVPTGGVRSLLAAPDGVWAIGRDSANLIRPGGVVRFVTGRDLPGTQIATGFEDRRGAVWLGTNGGVARVWQGHVQSQARGGDTENAAVLAINEDRDGDIWIGTETAGLQALRERIFETLPGSPNSAEQPTTSVLQAANGAIWVGTLGGGVTRIESGKARTYKSKDGLTSDTILALASGAPDPGDVWVGTPDGLNLLHDGRWRALTSSDGLADDLVRSLLVARDGAVWIGSRHGVTRWKDGKSTTLTKAQGLGSDLVGPMLEQPGGDLWIGTSAGLTRIHSGAVRNYTTADGLPGSTIAALQPAEAGGFWVAVQGQGLARWDGSRFAAFSGAKSIPQDISGLVEDGAGFLWITSAHGMFRVRIADLNRYLVDPKSDVPVAPYGPADGLPTLESGGIGYPSLWELKDGKLAIATRRGVILADPSLSAANDIPRVLIEESAVDGRIASGQELRSVAPGSSHFAFSFAGIHLAAPHRVQYRYMLQGLDRNWVDAGTRRTAYYTNLPHGRYVFRVCARDAGGQWSEPLDLPVDVRPHVYETAWFRALLVLCIGLLGFAMYRMRVRSLQSRFALISAERSRLAREIHDTLAQSFVAVSVRLELMAQMLRGAEGVDACREQLNQTRALVRDSLAEARRSIWDLRAEGTAAQSLPARLAGLVQESRTKIPDAQLETSGTYRPLPQPTEDELFRIAQEAVTNAIRHAHAASMQVRLKYQMDSLALEVADNGRGFEVGRIPVRNGGHFGITGIRERARILDAAVMLESEVGQGTRVRVEVPLRRESARRGERI